MAGTIATTLLLLVKLALSDDPTPTPTPTPSVDQTELSAPVVGIARVLNVGPMAAAEPVVGNVTSQRNWTVVCDSEQAPNSCNNVLDGNNNTFWRSGSNGWPHTLTVDMKGSYGVSGIAMLPSNTTEGNIATHEIYLSLDGTTWNDPVAYGTWWGDATQKTAVFQPAMARFVRLVAMSTALDEAFLNMAEFNVFIIDKFVPPTFRQEQGRWGPTIDFPIVPAGAWVDPISGKVVTYSSYGHDRFDQRQGLPPDILGRTLTSNWDPATGEVSQRIVNETGHDMFCPGMSFDVNGRMIITGGRTNLRTSIYEPDTQAWVRYQNMHIERGYQSSVTVMDGRVFTIGGSWDSVNKQCLPKDAEIYDPKTNKWTLLPRCPVGPMLTAEKSKYMMCDTFRSDNHGWLFSWKAKTVFQAGPSKQMNWYTVSTAGGISPASNRSDDLDAMCGIAVMYDAVNGKILTAGGSIRYINSYSRNSAYLISLNDQNFNKTVAATNAAPMAYARIYHNAIILPNGDTMVVGGRTRGAIFQDGDRAVLQPEIYSPTKNVWSLMANHSIPRNYHSVAVLLPDATVISGGGGLCGDCPVNHFDAQIFTPPYLLTGTGALATRPVITSTNTTSVPPGGKIGFTTDSKITSASFIRYGSATHGVNTDQRRIALRQLATLGTNQYAVTLPIESGVVIPGYWMLFVMNAQGVPSKAATFQVPII